ncbi:MAG: TIGR04282 family arsenosugar biosynthesis glycosyltransferase [Bacteroidetes bacterium]|nr:TIGR04282 family arsenosugar biosynthesis glycosyltransferase [Bacteroidota bacterium]
MKDTKQEKALAIFLKNQRLGAVKTRLAKAIGDQKALEIYTALVALTLKAASDVSAETHLFLSDTLEPIDSTLKAKQHVQVGNGLGERMNNAFGLLLKEYHKVVLIGSDLPDISATLIEEAFTKLDAYDVVIGPAKDGGYYLIGLKAPKPTLFTSIEFSTSEVFEHTIMRAEAEKIKVAILNTLRDVDTLEDLAHFDFLNI